MDRPYDKATLTARLRVVYNEWEDRVAGLTEEEATAPIRPGEWSIKDTIAHLRAWQQVSIARLEAARRDSKPVLPSWLGGSDPESDADLEQFNVRIHAAYRQERWSRLHQEWKDGFLRFLDLAGATPEQEMMDEEKYPWLNGYSLLAVLQGSYEHHDEHLESLRN